MRRRQALKLLAGLAFCPLCSPRGFAADAHWTYEGADGPAKWADLDPVNRACSVGSEQSPINVREPIQAQLAPLNIIWAKNAETIVNNGHRRGIAQVQSQE
jgi:carbonic anhydrase